MRGSPGRAMALSGFMLAVSASSGCGHKCVEDLDLDCEPLYTPDFDEISARTLQPSCALPGTGCHGSEGGRGGLIFVDPDFSYELLTGGEFPRAIAGDPGCSDLIIRLESNRKSVVMPRGAKLDAAERCSIIQWVANGAQR